jgi:radical SAM family uncharacterized protein/radical SAM-linked protein
MNSNAADHPYASFIQRVKKPAQYLGGETGEVRKDWDAVRAHVCLAFPDLYEVGMSHLGFKILYSILNGASDTLAERAYAPARDMEAALRERGEPLRSLETARPLRDFDVVGFSLQFELTFSNVLTMLDLGGIPLRAADRDDTHPLVIAGGPVATHAEPVAPFFDAFLIGDGEERALELTRRWAELRDQGISRHDRLVALAALEGIYVPSLYDTAIDPDTGFVVVDRPRTPEASLPVMRTFLEDFRDHPFPTDGPVAATETVFDRVSVEIARGCTEGCRFCQAGMIYRPVRERDPEEIASTIQDAVRYGGYDEASLTSLSTADYSAITPLVKRVMDETGKQRISLSVSSLRAYGLGEDVLDEMKKTRATGLTFAPEAGTQRMRDVVNKNVTDAQLMETAERVFRRGWQKMKLYFMIGLPTEEDDDVRGIVDTGQRALEVGQNIQGKRSPRVTVSVSTHVPKPHTPFQWCAMDDHATVVRKQQILRDEARRSRVQLRMHDSKGTWLEGILSRGDRSLADVVETAWQNGARFDSWEEELDLDAWTRAFETHATDTDRFLGTIPVSARLPWDHIDVGLEEGFLAREYRKSLKNRLSPPCGKAAGMFVHHTNLADAEADARRLVCYDCGIACDLGKMREERGVFLTKLGAIAPGAARTEEAREQVTTPKERRPLIKVDQGPGVRVRLAYTRLGRIAFSSHLDMVRLLPRIFRRAELPLFYSEGYHPKPVMTFGPSLPLGTASYDELLDLKLRARDVDAIVGDRSIDALEALCRRLDAASIDGIRFTGARILGAGDESLSKSVDLVEYVAAIPASVGGSAEAMEETLRTRREAGELVVERTIKGQSKRVDVARFLVDAGFGDESSEARLIGAGIEDRIALRIMLRVGPTGTARASEAVEALLGLPASVTTHEVRYVRTGQFKETPWGAVSPLALETLRRAVSAQTTDAQPLKEDHADDTGAPTSP